MSPRELSEKTPVPLKWLIGAVSAAFVAGGGYAVGQARAEEHAASLEKRVTTVEQRVETHGEQLHDQDKRIALLQQAVISLNEIARELKGRQ